MKIYLRVHKDQGYHVAHLWSKHIKEQIIETVNFACDDHDGCIGEPALFPTFWQQEIHSRRLYVGDPKKCKYWLNPPMYHSALYGRKPILTLRTIIIGCATMQNYRMTSPASQA